METNITGEIILVNIKNRSAMVFDETNNRIVEVPLNPIMRDDDQLHNTVEFLPKEGQRVVLGNQNNDLVIVGIETVTSYHRETSELIRQRKLTNINAGDPLLADLVTDDLSREDGYDNTNREMFGSYDPVYRRVLGENYNYAGMSYDDLMGGDVVFSSKDGNAIGVLEGGVNFFKASDLCQIIGIRYNDLLRMVSRNFEHFTDFGNITIVNDKGRTSYVLEGAPSYSEANMGRFTLRIEMGHLGDTYKISVLDGNETVLSQIHMKGNGDVIETSQNHQHTIHKNKKETVYGTETKDVRLEHLSTYWDDYNRVVKGSETKSVQNNQTRSVKNDDTLVIGRNQTINIGGVKSEAIAGSLIGTAEQKDIFVGDKTTAITTLGDFNRTIGVSGDFSDETLSGNFNRSTGTGDFSDVTLVGDYIRTTYFGNVTEFNNAGDRKTTVSGGDLFLDVFTGIGGGGKANIKIGLPGVQHEVDVSLNSITVTDSTGNKLEMTPMGIKLTQLTGAELNLSAGRVALGGLTAELLDLIDQFLDVMMDTEMSIAMHIHGSVMGPTTVPVNSAEFIMYQVQLSIIKGLLNTIKGTL